MQGNTYCKSSTNKHLYELTTTYPAIQSQCAAITVPVFVRATQGLCELSVTLYEGRTSALNSMFLDGVTLRWNTV